MNDQNCARQTDENEPMITRFETTKIVGIRAVQLAEGNQPNVRVQRTDLRDDYTYVASLELYNRSLDACVMRGERVTHVSELAFPVDLIQYLNTRDGGNRMLFDSHSLNTDDSLTSKESDSISNESFSF